MVMSYERVQIGKRFYLVCAECRRAHAKGFKPCYLVPQPGQPVPSPMTKQSLCRPCYYQQFKRIYPELPLPALEDTLLEDHPDPVPFDTKYLQPVYKDEFEIWEDAVIAARGSSGSESVAQAYARLSGINAPDIDISGPPVDLGEVAG